jgi:hypothetical protein
MNGPGKRVPSRAVLTRCADRPEPRPGTGRRPLDNHSAGQLEPTAPRGGGPACLAGQGRDGTSAAGQPSPDGKPGARPAWAVNRGEDGRCALRLTGLGELEFEDLAWALAIKGLGSGVQVFGDGPDGGREAAFDGMARFPDPDGPWDRYGVVQAKFRRQPLGTEPDAAWLRAQITAEFEAWSDIKLNRVKHARRPAVHHLRDECSAVSRRRPAASDRARPASRPCPMASARRRPGRRTPDRPVLGPGRTSPERLPVDLERLRIIRPSGVSALQFKVEPPPGNWTRCVYRGSPERSATSRTCSSRS